MSFTNINAALVAGYQAVGLELPTAYEGRDFAPTTGQPWATVSLVPLPIVGGSLGVAGNDRHSGTFQIDLNDTPGGGIDRLLSLADALRAYFKSGRQLDGNGLPVLVNGTSRAAVINKDGWLRMTVSVAWTAWTDHG